MMIKRLWGKFKRDHTLGRVVRNSGLLFISNAISAVISIVTANILGVANFGALGIIITFVSSVNRLLSFRMSELVVRYVGEYVEKGEDEKAGAIVKAAGISEAVTSLIAYGILAILAPVGAIYIAKDPAATPLFLLYGISILGLFMSETSAGVLQVGNYYLSQSVINLIQTIVTAVIIFIAYFTRGGITLVLWGYLAGKLIAGLGPVIMALIRLPAMLGKNWWKASLRKLPPFKELTQFGLSTNFSSTLNMIVRDSEVLWIGWLFSPLVAGYYKTALAILNLVIMPINPFITTTFPELMRKITSKLWKELRSLLKRVTFIAGMWTVAVIIGLAVLGKPVLFTAWIPWRGHLAAVYKSEFLPALDILLILMVGYGFGNSLFWSRSLLLAFGKANDALRIAFWAALAKIALTVLVVPRLGYIWEAVFFSAYLLITVLIMVGKGMAEVRKAEWGSVT